MGAPCSQKKKMYAKSSLHEEATALKLGNVWPEESPCREELALLRATATVCIWQAQWY